MFSKTAKILLAASTFGGLDVPAKAGIYMPPKPAIVKAENLEFSKHMLLAMPLTLGMLKRVPFYIAGNESGTNAATGTSLSWSHTTTAATNYLIVTAFVNNNAGTGQVNSATYNGVSMTLIARTTVGGQGQVAILGLANPAIGTFTASVSYSSGDRGICASAVNYGGITGVDVSGTTNQTTVSTITTTVTSTRPGLGVGSTSTTIAGSGTVTHTYNSPSGMTSGFSHSFLSNSNRKFHTTGVYGTILPAGSNSLSVTDNVTAAGRHQAYAILY